MLQPPHSLSPVNERGDEVATSLTLSANCRKKHCLRLTQLEQDRTCTPSRKVYTTVYFPHHEGAEIMSKMLLRWLVMPFHIANLIIRSRATSNFLHPELFAIDAQPE